MTAERPGPWQWLRYSVGAGLPPELHAWVLRDTTGPTWVPRHLARALVYVVPLVLAVLLLLPGPFWIRGMAAIGGTVMALIWSAAYMVESTERRLVKAGYPPNTGETTRRQRAAETRKAALERRQQRLNRRLSGRS